MKDGDKKPEREFVIHIDREPYKVTQSQMAVRELLVLAGEDPTETTLVRRHGNEQHRYRDVDEVVELSNGLHFTVFHNGPTPVS